MSCTYLIDSEIKSTTYFEETNNMFYSIYQGSIFN
jgi:hypothetical protein